MARGRYRGGYRRKRRGYYSAGAECAAQHIREAKELTRELGGMDRCGSFFLAKYCVPNLFRLGRRRGCSYLEKLVVPAKLAHRNRAVVLDDGTAKPDPMIARALARAHEWRRWLDRDEVHSYRDIANKAEVDPSYVQILLPLAFLDPQITRELLDGRCQISGGLIEFLRRGIPLDWLQQRELFQNQPTQS